MSDIDRRLDPEVDRRLDSDLEQLHRYHDGELGGFERWRFERRLRGSEALQSELAALRGLSEQIGRVGPGAPNGLETPSPDLWASIASALPAIDAQVEDERARGAVPASEPVADERGGLFGLPIPAWALGSAALAVAATLALMLVLPNSQPQPTEELAAAQGAAPIAIARPAGTVRYLDTGGRPVMVIEDPAESMTIVWMMDSV